MARGHRAHLDRGAALPALALLASPAGSAATRIWTNFVVGRAHTIPGADIYTLLRLADQITQPAIPPQQWEARRRDLRHYKSQVGPARPGLPFCGLPTSIEAADADSPRLMALNLSMAYTELGENNLGDEFRGWEAGLATCWAGDRRTPYM